MDRTTGEYIPCTAAREPYRAFLPAPLPPEPGIRFDSDLLGGLDRANRALGRLDGYADVLPDADLFLYHYVRKEALLSSQIEGTQSSYSDLLLFELDEAPGVPIDDVREVSNYVAALTHGLDRLKGGIPISLRLFREMHGILLRGGRGAGKSPGEFRHSQVWLGGTRPGNAAFVPPPPDKLMECLDPFEKFLHAERDRLPVLVRAALAHVQFETIHPFLDGNGRVGRLLITLMLCEETVLKQPILYLSLYFKQNRTEYYDRLQAVRTKGDWEGWLRFFLEGVYLTSREAVETARAMLKLFEEDRQRIQGIGRIAGSCLRVHHYLQKSPICRVAWAAQATGINRTTVSNCLAQLQELGIVREITGQKRNRLFAYDKYLNALAEGTEPLQS